MLDRRALKIIACLSMLADHVCLAFFNGTTAGMVVRQSAGRLAFPLFAYMLCQGFFYTRSRSRYALCLLATALVSEPFFDRSLYSSWFSLTRQNTVFTLLAALLLLIIIERFTKNNIVVSLIIAAGFAAGAQFARLDYGAAGIAVCVIYYYARSLEPHQACIAACIPLILVFGTVGALLAAFVLWYYTDTRQRLSRAEKLLFYLFYPGHLAAVSLILTLLR